MGKLSVAPRVRNLQRVKRSLSDGTFKLHYYHRPTGRVLPAPDNPNFPQAYAEAEEAFAQRNASKSQVLEFESAPASLVDQTDTHGQKNDSELYLTPEEVSLRWRRKVDVETIANWRSQRIGPPYHRFGRAVLYRIDLLEEWERQNLISTDVERNREQV